MCCESRRLPGILIIRGKINCNRKRSIIAPFSITKNLKTYNYLKYVNYFHQLPKNFTEKKVTISFYLH